VARIEHDGKGFTLASQRQKKNGMSSHNENWLLKLGDIMQLTSYSSQHLWCDTVHAGNNGYPDGLTEIDEDELTGAIHPAEDPSLSGLDPNGGRI